jgi:hypothetical protein
MYMLMMYMLMLMLSLMMYIETYSVYIMQCNVM